MPSREALKRGTVALLLGGRSAEREISLKTGRAIERVLRELGYEIELIDPVDDALSRLSAMRPVAAVVALHGRYGEDGCVQGLLECLQVPYTGSGVLASAMAMDKAVTKKLAASVNIDTPEHVLFDSGDQWESADVQLPFPLPAVVKPAREGSSVGITLVEGDSELAPALAAAADLEGPVLVERYIKGKELSVAVLDGEPLGAIEIVPARTFYDYAAKYDPNSGTRYLHPPPIDEELGERLARLAADAFEVLGCDGVCRADFMVDEDGKPWFIEINTLPGMTETSLVPKIAAGVGISFQELCERLLLGARLKA